MQDSWRARLFRIAPVCGFPDRYVAASQAGRSAKPATSSSGRRMGSLSFRDIFLLMQRKAPWRIEHAVVPTACIIIYAKYKGEIFVLRNTRNTLVAAGSPYCPAPGHAKC